MLVFAGFYLFVFKFKTIVVQFCSIFKRTNGKRALQIMSYHILCKSKDSWERSIVYHTQYENYIVFIQQKKNSEKGCWRSIEHCILPKMFVNFVATLPDKYVSTEDNGTKTVLTLGGYSVPRKMPLLFPYDIDTLSPDTKRFCTDTIVTVCLFLRINSANSRQSKNWLNFGEFNLRQLHKLLHQLDHRQQTTQAPLLRRKQQIQNEKQLSLQSWTNCLAIWGQTSSSSPISIVLFFQRQLL